MEGVEFRQYLIRIAVINWLLSLFRNNPELCTHESLMQELAEWLWSDVCWLEGCDNPLLGYNSNAFYCCAAHALRGWAAENPEYYQAPERKAYHKAYRNTPEHKTRQKAYMKEYNQRPERKAYDRARNQAPERKAYQQTTERKAYQKEYQKEYQQRPEVKVNKREYQKAYRARKKAEKASRAE